MNSTSKTITAVVIVIVIALGIWVYVLKSSNPPSTGSTTAGYGTGTDQSSMPVATSSPSDTSDAAINQDINATDSQMNGLSNDSANVNQATGVSSN